MKLRLADGARYCSRAERERMRQAGCAAPRFVEVEWRGCAALRLSPVLESWRGSDALRVSLKLVAAEQAHAADRE